MKKLLFTAVVVSLLIVGCTPQNPPKQVHHNTPTPLLTRPPRLFLAVTPTVTPKPPNRSATALPAAQGEIVINPDYIQSLNEVYAVGLRAARNPSNIAWLTRQALYAQLEHMATLVDDPLKAQTERLLIDFKIGLELRDTRPIKKALESIQEIRQALVD